MLASFISSTVIGSVQSHTQRSREGLRSGKCNHSGLVKQALAFFVNIPQIALEDFVKDGSDVGALLVVSNDAVDMTHYFLK